MKAAVNNIIVSWTAFNFTIPNILLLLDTLFNQLDIFYCLCNLWCFNNFMGSGF